VTDLQTRPPQAYQYLPALDDEQRHALRQSIEANGILQPIEVDETGRILDGHHRSAIAAELGIACPTRVVEGLDEAGKRKYAITVNLMRRQLDRTARGALVAQLRTEGMSIRAIARETGFPKSTVADLVDELSEAGQLEQPERVKSLDGKERPATQPPRATAEVEQSATEPLSDDGRRMLADAEARIAANLPHIDPSVFEDGAQPGPSPEPVAPEGDAPALPWPVAEDRPPRIEDDTAHAARVSNDVRRLITLAQTFGSAELRAQAVALYSDHLGNAAMPPSGVVSAQEIRKAGEAILALAKDWKRKK
jgi:ParB-like chromosome segregation protein Spo0J